MLMEIVVNSYEQGHFSLVPLAILKKWTEIKEVM